MMKMLCDACESAAAIIFCAADEAALCRRCDDKVHKCNKLASRHLRVGLAEPTAAPRCDICENAPAFFYCEIDGSSLCLQCDTIVHVGGKRTHERYLLLRQGLELPGDRDGMQEVQLQLGEANKETSERLNGNGQKHRVSPDREDSNKNKKIASSSIDLNSKPRQAQNNQEHVIVRTSSDAVSQAGG